jgi:hypothetical protein
MCSSCWSFVFSALGVIVPLGYFLYQNILFTAERRNSIKTYLFFKILHKRKWEWRVNNDDIKIERMRGVFRDELMKTEIGYRQQETTNYLLSLRYTNQWDDNLYIKIIGYPDHPSICSEWDIFGVKSSLIIPKGIRSLKRERKTGLVFPCRAVIKRDKKKETKKWKRLCKKYSKCKQQEDQNTFIDYLEIEYNISYEKPKEGNLFTQCTLKYLSQNLLRYKTKKEYKEKRLNYKRLLLISRALTPEPLLDYWKEYEYNVRHKENNLLLKIHRIFSRFKRRILQKRNSIKMIGSPKDNYVFFMAYNDNLAQILRAYGYDIPKECPNQSNLSLKTK